VQITTLKVSIFNLRAQTETTEDMSRKPRCGGHGCTVREKIEVVKRSSDGIKGTMPTTACNEKGGNTHGGNSESRAAERQVAKTEMPSLPTGKEG